MPMVNGYYFSTFLIEGNHTPEEIKAWIDAYREFVIQNSETYGWDNWEKIRFGWCQKKADDCWESFLYGNLWRGENIEYQLIQTKT